jgi:hypothetical protein
MRTSVVILSDFDDPLGVTPPINEVDSITDSIRARLNIEILLDMRELLVEVKDVLDECKEELQECKEELQEIKENTA